MFRIFYPYRRAILLTLLTTLFIGSTTGGYFYVRYSTREAHLQDASHQYMQLTQASKGQVLNITSDTAHTFIQKYSDTPYAGLLQLQLAKQAVENNQLSDAMTWLRLASEKATDPNIRCVARERGARVLVAMGKLKEALVFLSETAYIDDYRGSIEELKGDIYQALGDTEKARQAYQQAYEIAPYLVDLKPIFPAKLATLGSP